MEDPFGLPHRLSLSSHSACQQATLNAKSPISQTGCSRLGVPILAVACLDQKCQLSLSKLLPLKLNPLFILFCCSLDEVVEFGACWDNA